MALPRKKNKAIVTTLKQYTTNPYKGSAYLASRKMIKQGLNMAFIDTLRKFRRHFYAIPYIDNNTGNILFHVKVPSQEYDINGLTYDVLFLIEGATNITLANRNVKMFSNSPSFIFTYAYVYYHDDLLIKDFENKIPLVALLNAPEIRNPVESLGYEKSTYFAARYLIDGLALTRNYINKFKKNLDPFSLLTIQNNIADPETIVQVYALAREMQVKKRRKAEDLERLKKRQELKKSYTQKQQKSRPKTGLKRKPQTKITARKASKSLMNKKKR